MKITVFSATNCGVCHAVMQWLDRQNISYTDKVVDLSDKAMSDFMEINDGMIGTPFTVIEHEGKTTKIAGFDMAKFKAALGV